MIHRSLFAELPPLLRIYVQCAAHRYGDPAQADLIKIHKHSGKVTFQHYDDFDGKPLPELQTRIKVNLRNLFVEVFDHSIGPKIQLLYFKERFVGKDHAGTPGDGEIQREAPQTRPRRSHHRLGAGQAELSHALAAVGLNENLNPTRSRSKSTIDDVLLARA